MSVAIVLTAWRCKTIGGDATSGVSKVQYWTFDFSIVPHSRSNFRLDFGFTEESVWMWFPLSNLKPFARVSYLLVSIHIPMRPNWFPFCFIFLPLSWQSCNDFAQHALTSWVVSKLNRCRSRIVRNRSSGCFLGLFTCCWLFICCLFKDGPHASRRRSRFIHRSELFSPGFCVYLLAVHPNL